MNDISIKDKIIYILSFFFNAKMGKIFQFKKMILKFDKELLDF